MSFITELRRVSTFIFKNRGLESWISVITGIIGILTLIYQFMSSSNELRDMVVSFWVFFLLVMATIFIAESWRKARYADAAELWHKAFHKLRDASWSVSEEHDNNVVLDKLIESVSFFKEAFMIITGKPCRACIKELFYSEPLNDLRENDNYDESMYVLTWVRCEGRGDRKKALISENTDFKSLWRNEKLKYYHSNNLLKEINYSNSNWPDDKEIKPGDVDYRSTIVWPIRKKLQDDDKHQDLRGYLCIDSHATNIFNIKWDFELGAAYADSLYSFMVFYRKKVEQEKVIKNEPKTKKKRSAGKKIKKDTKKE